jgi:hypothetical protein
MRAFECPVDNSRTTDMLEFLGTHFEHVLCALIFIGRIGDIGSTYLATPRLTLEGNPIVRKLGWRFAALSLLLCLVPYYYTPLGVMVAVPSLMVSASNIAKLWSVRALGEERYREFLYTEARSGKLSHAIAGVLVSQMFLALVALLLLFLSPNPWVDWGFWIAMGMLTYVLAMALYGCLFVRRIFLAAQQIAPAPIVSTQVTAENGPFDKMQLQTPA